MIKKHIIQGAVALAIVVLVTVFYFSVGKPYIDSKQPVVETPETLEGEELGTSNRYYMYNNLDRSQIESVEVNNEYGSFLIRKDDDGSFVIDRYENIVIDETVLSYLITTCGSTLSKAKVMDDAPAEKLAEYGLDEPRASWVVTDNEGKKYKVYVGRELLTGGGYYCRFAGRDSVYVLDTSLSYAILNPIEVYVTPYILFGVSTDKYDKFDNFTVLKENEKLVSIGIVPKEDQNNPQALVENVITHPAPYPVDTEEFFPIRTGFENFVGDSTYKLGVDENDIKECGLDTPQYAVSYDYEGLTYYFLVGDLTEDGYYYVVSNMYTDIISLVSKERLAYLEYGLLDWMYPYVFDKYINTITEITVKTDKVDETFHLAHGVDAKGNAALRVITDKGFEITSSEAIQDFRHYYTSFLSLQTLDYLPDTVPETGEKLEDFISDESNRLLSFSYKTVKGEEIVCEFYQYTTRRCAAVVNGEATFYVLSDVVQKIENDTFRILSGEDVVPYSKN